MPIGPSSRPDEPLHVGWMLLALVLAAALGGASGLIWHWFAGDELPVEEDAAGAGPEAGEGDEEAAGEPAAAPTPDSAPAQRRPVTIPAPSPNPG